ncbi:hypothetical protein D3C85_1854840 [compost metagenome]
MQHRAVVVPIDQHRLDQLLPVLDRLLLQREFLQKVHWVELLNDQLFVLDSDLGMRVALEFQIGLVAQDVHHVDVDLEGLGG